MSFIGRLLGAPEAMTEVVKAATSGMDALVYTDEERAGDAAADRTEARKMIVSWMDSTQGQNLARRLLALIITSVWLAQYAASLIGDMIEPWLTDPEFAGRFGASANAIAERAEGMNGAMMLILGFYFAAPHMSDIVGTALGRFSSRRG